MYFPLLFLNIKNLNFLLQKAEKVPSKLESFASKKLKTLPEGTIWIHHPEPIKEVLINIEKNGRMPKFF